MDARVYYSEKGYVNPDDDMSRFKALEHLTHMISFEDYEPSVAEFENFYFLAGVEPDVEDPTEVWRRWNAGSGHESEAFTTVECKDCGLSFHAEGGEFSARSHLMEGHEKDVDHEFEKPNRSMQVGDIVVIDGTAHVCASFGWTELDFDVSTINEKDERKRVKA